MKRAAVALLAVAAATLVIGCASADHSWRGEFDARLEGATATIEAARESLSPRASEGELIEESPSFARQLAFKSNLIARLNAPADCEELNEGAAKEVFATAQFTSELAKDETPYLRRRLPEIWKERVAALAHREREAETCE